MLIHYNLSFQLESSPLHKAAARNDVVTLEQLLLHGADPNMIYEVCNEVLLIIWTFLVHVHAGFRLASSFGRPA